MFTSFTTYPTNPYNSETNWVLLRKYNTFLSTKTNQTNRCEKNYPSNSSPTRLSSAEIQYFEESSPLICVDRTPHDPPGYSLGETNLHDPVKNALFKGPGALKNMCRQQPNKGGVCQ